MALLTPFDSGQIDLTNPVNRLHPLALGLLSWWLVIPGQNAGSTWRDLMKTNNGTLTNMGDTVTAWTPTNRRGGFGTLNFDGSNDYVNTANFADNLTTMSVSAWFNNQNGAASNYVSIVTKLDNFSSATGWALAQENSGVVSPYSGALIALIQSNSGNNYIEALTTANFADGNWHHVVWTKTSNTYAGFTIYVDGVSVTLQNLSGPAVSSFTNSSNVVIGSDANALKLFNGPIDDVRIYNRALSAAEASAMYYNSLLRYPGLLNTIRPSYPELVVSVAGGTVLPFRSLMGVGY